MSVNQVSPVSSSCRGASGSQKSSRCKTGLPVVAMMLNEGAIFLIEGGRGRNCPRYFLFFVFICERVDFTEGRRGGVIMRGGGAGAVRYGPVTGRQ